MQELSKQLRELRDAKDAGEFVKKEKLAYKACDYVEGEIKRLRKAAEFDVLKEQELQSLDSTKLKINPRKKLSQEELDSKIIQHLQNDLKAQLDDFKTLAYELVDGDISAPIKWIDGIPALLLSNQREKREKAKKLIISLIKIASQRNIGTWETTQSLKRQVTLMKTSGELKKLQKGVVIQGCQLDSLEQRFKNAAARESVADNDPAFIQHVKEKETYLHKKGVARGFALGLNGIVSVGGIGLLTSIALVSFFAIPLYLMPLAVGLCIGFAFPLGYTEGFVYFDYVNKFCREVFVNFFTSIDHKILNREAGERYNKRDRHLLTPAEIEEIYANCYKERVFKKILVGFAFFVSIAAGFGYMGLLFTEVAEFLTVYGLLASVPALIAVPWIIAGVVAPIYAIVMCGMLYKAIKDNCFAVIIDHLRDIYSYDRANEKHKEKNNGAELNYSWHVFMCMLKTIGIALIIGFSVVALAAVMGLWIQNSITFVNRAIGVVENIAEAVGWAIGAIYGATMIWFCVEKSLYTINKASEVTWENVKASFKDSFSSPKKFFTSVPNLVLMLFHFAANSAFAVRGSLQKVYEGVVPSEIVKESVVGASDVLSEGAIDAGDNVIEQHHHHHQSSYAKYNLGEYFKTEKKDEHDEGHHHSHGNIGKTGIAIGRGFASLVRTGLTKFGLLQEKQKQAPRQLHAFGVRSSV